MAALRNVLIAGAESSAPLVRAFRAALAGEGRVLAGGADPACPGAQAADDFLALKEPDAPGALEQMLAACAAHGVALAVPARDADLPFFAAHRALFEAKGVRVLAPSPETVRACQDLRAFTRMLDRYGYPSIPVLRPDAADLEFPLFARPAAPGAGGRPRRIDTPAELEGVGEDELLHPFIDAPEATIDLLMDLDGGRPVQAVARERVLVVGGESRVSRVIDAPEAVAVAMRLGAALGLVGHNVVHAFLHPRRGVLLTRIHPRFGGASSLSIAAGLDSPRRILQMLAGDEAAFPPRPIDSGAALVRTDRDTIVPGAAP